MDLIIITILFIISIILLIIVHYQALVIEDMKKGNNKVKNFIHKTKF